MKALTKHIYLTFLTLICLLSLLFGSVFSFAQTTSVQADAVALQTEFTNNGQFTVSKYNGVVPFECVDGATEGLPAGYSGSVLKIPNTSDLAYAVLDFSSSNIKASSVESIVVRIYSPGYTAKDEFRTNVGSDGKKQVQYGAGAYDMSTWCDITLNATSMSTMTDANGYLANIAVGTRIKGGASVYYIDSVTVNMKEEAKSVNVTFTGINLYWNNYFNSNLYCSILEFSGGIGIGGLDGDYSDVYAKATLNGQPIDTSNLSFVCRKWVDGKGDSIVMRWVNLPADGSILYIPAGATFKNGGADTNVYTIATDIYLQLNGEKWAKIDKPLELEKATFVGPWGTAGDFNGANQVLLQYSCTSAWDHTNKGDLASKITYKNSETGATYAATENNIAGWNGQKWIVLTGLNGYDIIEIAAGGTFGGNIEIPALTLYNVNGCWVTTAPHDATAYCTKLAAGWNNNVVSGLSNNIVSFDVNPLGTAVNASNLAATLSRTSLMVKYNGKTFFELYAGNKSYTISYAHGNNHFYFAIPEADLVEGATFEIEEGTPFMNHYLAAVKLVFKSGAWELHVEKNYTPDFVSIGAANHLENGKHYGVSLKYNTNGFTSENNQVMAASTSGITINGEAQAAALWGGDQLLFWLSGEKLVAGYNGYSHATLEIAKGAKVVNENGEEFTLGTATLYLVNGAWTTQKPVNYEIKEEEVVIPDLGTPNCLFNGIGIWNNENGLSTLLEFANFENLPTVEESVKATTGHYITLNGVRLSEVAGANVHTWGGTYWMHLQIPNPAEGSVLIIEEGTPFAGNYLPRIVLKFVNGLWREAFTVRIVIDDEVFNVYSQNDVPVVLDDAYFASLLADSSIPGKAVSFSTRGVTYPAGTIFKALTNTDITVQTIGFSTTEGASVRLKTPTGIRYETKIDKADYDALIARYGEANVETGTYILPISLMDTDFRTYFADSKNVDDVDYVKIVNAGFANQATCDTDGYYVYYGSLVNIRSHNYCTDFFGIGYIKITDGENEYTVYGGYDVDEYTRSIYYVSASAYNDYADGSSEKAILKSYMDSVVYIADEAVISNIVDIAGYTSPYSIQYDAQTGIYTVTGNAEIKCVMMGGKKVLNFRTSTLTINGVEYYITDYNLTSTENFSTLTFKLSDVIDPLALVDFALEIPSNSGVKILQITDTELMDAAQMRTDSSLSAAEQETYARKNIYANCFNYITQLVEQDRPDLIIVTGDAVNGLFDDNGTMWLRFIEFMDSFDIPWSYVFGTLEGESAMGATWQRAQLANAKNCLFKDSAGYTIGITDNDVIRRVVFLFDSGICAEQTSWMKGVASDIKAQYGDVPAFALYSNTYSGNFASDFAAANVDGVFMGNSPNDNSTTQVDGISYTYGTKTGVYGEYQENILGGTYISIGANGLEFVVSVEYLNITEMKNKKMIKLVATYDGSSIVDDAYLAPIWDTDRIYDETGVFVGETGSVTLMYTPSNPKEVVIRDITLGVTYTYGLDYTISGNKVTRVAGGNLPYVTYEEYYRETPVTVNGVEQGWKVDTVEDDYRYSGTRYMNYAEAYNGVSRYVTFTYDKTEAWTGTTITGDSNAQSFIDKLKTEKTANVLFYGDSITVGCNASGTQWGGNRNPFLPAWDNLVVNSLEELYGATITKYNVAVGGWTTAQGAENLNSQVSSAGASLAEIDLFVIAFGMNDPVTSEADYKASIKQMINAYYAVNPNGSVLLVSPMLPNTQSKMICGNQTLWENALNSVKNSTEYRGKNISLAKVYTIFSELVSISGKLPRDYLGNNVNHPTDFGVRIYAQVVLKTLCGEDFYF